MSKVRIVLGIIVAIIMILSVFAKGQIASCGANGGHMETTSDGGTGCVK